MMAYLPNEVPGPRPTVDDQVFWDYCQQQELRFQRCAACQRFRHPPAPVCPQCRSVESEWVRAPETGVVFSFTIVHHPAHPAVSAVTPYNIVIVDFPECSHTRLVSNLIDVLPEEVRIGLPVVLVWEATGNGRIVPRFKKGSD
jgi:uncharacterized OB-fold protein